MKNYLTGVIVGILMLGVAVPAHAMTTQEQIASLQQQIIVLLNQLIMELKKENVEIPQEVIDQQAEVVAPATTTVESIFPEPAPEPTPHPKGNILPLGEYHA